VSNYESETYAAFCRQFGDYCTPTVGPHNWNEEALEGMSTGLTRPWQALRSTIDRQVEAIATEIEEIMNSAGQSLGKIPILVPLMNNDMHGWREPWGYLTVPVPWRTQSDLRGSPQIAITLKQALVSRRRLILAELDQHTEKLDTDLWYATDALGFSTCWHGSACI
jgi:hypothetical protein